MMSSGDGGLGGGASTGEGGLGGAVTKRSVKAVWCAWQVFTSHVLK